VPKFDLHDLIQGAYETKETHGNLEQVCWAIEPGRATKSFSKGIVKLTYEPQY
jgi:hypothetical protein